MQTRKGIVAWGKVAKSEAVRQRESGMERDCVRRTSRSRFDNEDVEKFQDALKNFEVLRLGFATAVLRAIPNGLRPSARIRAPRFECPNGASTSSPRLARQRQPWVIVKQIINRIAVGNYLRTMTACLPGASSPSGTIRELRLRKFRVHVKMFPVRVFGAKRGAHWNLKPAIGDTDPFVAEAERGNFPALPALRQTTGKLTPLSSQ